jgi:penicillin V acylase-like amidase (Ntn superfamily)
VNKAGVEKRAVADSLAARWVSKYGSVTVNQYGREMPHGGINERGLAIALAWLVGTEYPAVDQRQAIGELEWIQYQLDNCATVEEVLESDSRVRVEPRGPAPIHYFVADSSGACAVVEYLDGVMVAHTGEVVPVMTNNPYMESLEYLRIHESRPDDVLPAGRSSPARFIRAARLLEMHRPRRRNAVARASALLDSIAMRGYTAWSLVYELGEKRMHVRTTQSPKPKRISLSSVRFDAGTPVVMLDMNERGGGDVSDAFVPYSYAANLRLVREAIKQTDFLSHMTETDIEFNARIPETHTRCRDVSR